ncbi:MAG: (d)CMP kinase [Planctomycetota bacterium]
MDGPAGVGKSTHARRLAAKLNIAYLDTGATYRAVTLKAMREGMDLADTDRLVDIVRTADVRLQPGEGGTQVWLDGEDVTDAIRSNEVTNNVHYVANCGAAREVLVALQRAIGEALGGFVAEGRDQGSVVFPEADIKFYFAASPAVRAQRRHCDLAAAGEAIALQQVQAELQQRDDRDRSRNVAPLIRPEGAIDVDTSDKTIEQVHAELLAHVESRPCR